MKCRSCGTQIAANALICYKCGAATEEPRIKPPASRPRGRQWARIAVGLLVGGALAVFGAQQAGCLTLL
ncbi:MAG TPA: zinc-ribbon domain-containing protein [Vicinamibacterales bacterium]|nr:zinc-ribbon domain-containing protein [Vicinamibacterales bacterium]